MATHKGLKFFNTSTHVFTIYDHKEGEANSPAEPHVMAIAIDSTGKVYTVLFGNKLDIFDPHNKSFLHCKFPVSTPALKRTPMIFKILLDKMGKLVCAWIKFVYSIVSPNPDVTLFIF